MFPNESESQSNSKKNKPPSRKFNSSNSTAILYPQSDPLPTASLKDSRPSSSPSRKVLLQENIVLSNTKPSTPNSDSASENDPLKDTATPLHDSVYFRVYEIFKYLCKVLPNHTQELRRFFQEPDFYGAHSHLIFSLATHCKSQQRYITIHVDTYNETIVPELSKKLNVSTSLLELSKDKLSSLYRDVVTVRFPNEDTYDKINEQLNKQNKKMYKSSNSKSESKKEPKYRNKSFADLLQTYENSVFICFDLEWHERDAQKILEFGWCVWSGHDMPLLSFHPPGETCIKQKYKKPMYVDPSILTRHYIVKEFMGVVNQQFVDNMKFDFLYGSSKVATMKEIKAIFEEEWNTLASMYNVAFVGHGIIQDISQLKVLDIHIPQDATIFDTNELQKVIFGNGRQLNLRDLVRQFGREPLSLHNAGNDSYYTMLCFREFTRHIPSQHLVPTSDEDRYKHYRLRQNSNTEDSEPALTIPIVKE